MIELKRDLLICEEPRMFSNSEATAFMDRVTSGGDVPSKVKEDLVKLKNASMNSLFPSLFCQPFSDQPEMEFQEMKGRVVDDYR